MLKHTKRAILGLALVLALNARPVAASPRAEIETLLPPESTQIVYLNLHQILRAGVFRKNYEASLKQSLEAPFVKGLLEVTKFDPYEHLHGLFAASILDLRDAKGLIVITGQFEVKQWLAAIDQIVANSGGVVAVDHLGGHTVVRVKNPWGQFPPWFYLSFADERTLLVSATPEALLQALARANESQKSHLKERELARVLANLRDDISLLIFEEKPNLVADLAIVPGVAQRLSAANSLGKVARAKIEVVLNDGVNLGLWLYMRDEDAAKEMRPVLKRLCMQLKQIVRFLVVENPQFKPMNAIMRQLHTDIEGNVLSVQFGLTAEDIQLFSQGMPGASRN